MTRIFEDKLRRIRLEYSLVRGQGLYTWSEDWIRAKQLVEHYEFLFESAIQMKRMKI